MSTHPQTPENPAERRGMPRLLIVTLGVAVATVCVVIGFAIGAYLMLVNNGIINPNWTEQNIMRSQQRGETIVTALNTYQSTHGLYPESLDPLLAESLDRIPRPVAGVDNWSYASVEGGSGFVLQFSANKYDDPTSWYESRHERWFVQDGGFVPED